MAQNNANPASNVQIEPAQWATMAAIGIVCGVLANRFVGLLEAKRSIEAGIQFACQHLLDLGAGMYWSASTMGMAITACAVVVPCAFYMQHLLSGTFRRGQEHGSARFATLKEMRAFADRKVPMGNVLLSKDAALSYRRPEDSKHERNRNILVIGGSGSGKTRGIVKPNLMQVPSKENCPKGMRVADLVDYTRSFIVTDPKGTTRMDTGQMFVQEGYDLKEFNVVDMASSNCFNPFVYLKDEADVQSFVTCFIKNTTPKDASASDPFWENSERKLYEGIINYMIEELPLEQRNFPMMCALLDMAKYDERNPGMSGLDILFYQLESGREYNPGAVKKVDRDEFSMWGAGGGDAEEVWKKVRKGKPNCAAVRAYRDVMSGAPETIQSILISVKVRLGRLRPESISSKLLYDEMELDQFGDRKMVLFLVPHDQDDTYNFLIAIIVWLQLKLLSNRAASRYAGKLPVGVDFLLDEAGNFYIPQLENTVATCRSRNIGVMIILQSNAQLKSRYGDDAATIIDCCDTLVFLGGQSTETTKMLEEIIGQQTVTTDNAGESKGAQHSMSKTIAQHGRALMQASEIAHMDRSHCLVLITGEYPWYGPKYDVTSHAMYRYIDPGHDKDDSSCPRHPFDTAAYMEEPAYFELPDARLAVESELSVTRDVADGKPLAALTFTLSAANAKSTDENPSGIALNFGGDVKLSCEVLPAPAGAGPDISRKLCQNASSAGLAWQQQPARYSISDGSDASIVFNNFSQRHVIGGWRIEPGQDAIMRFSMTAGAAGNPSIEDLAAGCPEGSAFTLRAKAEVELHCATAEVECFELVQDFTCTLGRERTDEKKGQLARCTFAKARGASVEDKGSWGHEVRDADEGQRPHRLGVLGGLGGMLGTGNKHSS